MVATGQDIELYAGDSTQIDVQIFATDGTTVLDLSGTTVNWALTSVYDKSRLLIVKTSAVSGQVTITDATNGLVTILVEPVDTRNLGGQPYYHEVEVIDLAQATVTVLTGAAIIKKTGLHASIAAALGFRRTRHVSAIGVADLR